MIEHVLRRRVQVVSHRLNFAGEWLTVYEFGTDCKVAISGQLNGIKPGDMCTIKLVKYETNQPTVEEEK